MAHIAKRSYDVFLCFRGEDTRHTFTGNLFNALCKNKMKVFMDDDGLKRGDDISFIYKALEQSSIAIVVFSKDFASSSYCIKEVVKMLELQKNSNIQVLPIFYEVGPSDVVGCGSDNTCNNNTPALMTKLKLLLDKLGRFCLSIFYKVGPSNVVGCESNNSRNNYITAFTKLQLEKFPDEPEKIQEWMSALSCVAPTSGSYEEWQLEDGGKYKYEHERIGKIVEWVTRNTIPRGDVFLSFLEKDTRYSFVEFLRDALVKERFKIHMHDDEEYEEMDQISLAKTIDESWLSIIILSENYASSPLRLNELVTILECMNTKEECIVVLPIFYKVEASDVRYQSNSFGSAIAEHENTLGRDSQEVKNWRSALAEVANLKGLHLKSGYEFETIENIVKEVINASYLPSPA